MSTTIEEMINKVHTYEVKTFDEKRLMKNHQSVMAQVKQEKNISIMPVTILQRGAFAAAVIILAVCLYLLTMQFAEQQTTAAAQIYQASEIVRTGLDSSVYEYDTPDSESDAISAIVYNSYDAQYTDSNEITLTGIILGDY